MRGRNQGERVNNHRRTVVGAVLLLGMLAVAGCGQPGPDPQAEAQQKLEADAMMEQYKTPTPGQK